MSDQKDKSKEFDKIDELFRSPDAEKKTTKQRRKHSAASAEDRQGEEAEERRWEKLTMKKVDKLLIDETGEEAFNYTGDEESERDYRPVRQSHEYKSGCLGGIMYFVFILCVSIILACLAWMATSDMLALNKTEFTANVTLPVSIFESETVDTLDENGNKTGTKRITRADIDYLADTLSEAGLIEYKWLFRAFCMISHADTKVSPGEYALRSTYDYRALIQHMRPGATGAVTVKVTFPEGFTMRQIFLRLEENGVADFDDLMDAAANYNFNYSFLEGLPEGDASRLEGYLFPDTYEFYVRMQASSAINKFLENYHYVITADMLQQADNLGYSMRDIIKIASIIEREAANDAERGRIASVIYNRLYAGMPIGIDATILYLFPEHEGAPTGTMLETDSPYNTRLYTGLPPTPVCNPGLMSIRAALSPEQTSYYYYALDTETGEHRFFVNAYEFDAFVATQNYG